VIVNSTDLIINRKKGHSLYYPSNPPGGTVHQVRWNSTAGCLEFEHNGQWIILAEDVVDIQLPLELSQLLRWCRMQPTSAHGVAAHDVVTRLLSWIQNLQDQLKQTQMSINQDACLADAWQEVELSLERFAMLETLTNKQGKS
jgi:hypothetical protein